MTSLKFAILTLLLLTWCSGVSAQDKLKLDRFGTIHFYRPPGTPAGLVLLISGDGGWEDRVEEIAKIISTTGVFVAGINIDEYLGSEKQRDWTGCPSQDLEYLTSLIQQREKIAGNKCPILFGYSSGATLAYAALLESPSSFSGAVTLGFCPDLRGVKLCEGERLRWTHPARRPRLTVLAPETKLPLRWFAIQGEMDIACGPDKIAAFIEQVPGATMITAKNVTHQFTEPQDYVASVIDALQEIEASTQKW